MTATTCDWHPQRGSPAGPDTAEPCCRELLVCGDDARTSDRRGSALVTTPQARYQMTSSSNLLHNTKLKFPDSTLLSHMESGDLKRGAQTHTVPTSDSACLIHRSTASKGTHRPLATSAQSTPFPPSGSATPRLNTGATLPRAASPSPVTSPPPVHTHPSWQHLADNAPVSENKLILELK